MERWRERIIRGFSDVELLKFHAAGGTVPPEMLPRLHRMLDLFTIGERRVLPPREVTPEPRDPRIPWVTTCCRMWKRKKVRILREKRQLLEVA